MIKAKDIVLRDFIESDIAKRIYWETIETEWQLWDAPWEYEGMTEAEREQELQDYIATMQQWVEHCKQYSEDKKRYTFQIVTNDAEQRYIGYSPKQQSPTLLLVAMSLLSAKEDSRPVPNR